MIASHVELEDWLKQRLLADARLRELTPEIMSIPGVPRATAEAFEKKLRGLFARVPAIGTYLPCGEYEYPDAETQIEKNFAWVLCAAANSREPGASLRGDARDAGAWELVEHCRRALSGIWPGQNIDTCRPVSWDLIWCNDQIAVCYLEVEIILRRPLQFINLPPGWTGGAQP